MLWFDNVLKWYIVKTFFTLSKHKKFLKNQEELCWAGHSQEVPKEVNSLLGPPKQMCCRSASVFDCLSEHLSGTDSANRAEVYFLFPVRPQSNKLRRNFLNSHVTGKGKRKKERGIWKKKTQTWVLGTISFVLALDRDLSSLCRPYSRCRCR